MVLPLLIDDTHLERQARFLEVYDAGAVDAHVHHPLASENCYFCHRPHIHGLHELRCRDGTTFKVGPDCLAAYNGLDAGNIKELRVIVTLGGK